LTAGLHLLFGPLYCQWNVYRGSAIFEKLGNHWSTEKTQIILNYYLLYERQ